MSLILALALQVAPPAPDTRHCTGARRGEVCTEAGRAALREQLGLQPLETETAQGVETYRAFYLEGGGGLPAVAFVRRPGGNPSVEVSAGGGQMMRADVPLEVWREIQAAGAGITQLPETVTENPEHNCMEGGAVLAEVGLPAPHPRLPAVSRQRTSNSCQPSAPVSFARLLTTRAEPLFPACAAIPAGSVPGGVFRLYNCFRLSGDQMAAAEVFGRLKQHQLMLEDDSVARKRLEWRRATGVDQWTRLRWAGEDVPPNAGDRQTGGATDFLIARSADLPGLDFHPVKFHGVSATVVEVDGHASYRPADLNGRSLSANYRQVWQRPSGRDWRVTEWSVEPFAPAS